MNDDKLNKPDNLDDKSWQQHLRWLSVMSEQVEENFTRHLARVKEDANRCEELLEQHQAVLQSQQSTQSLFND